MNSDDWFSFKNSELGWLRAPKIPRTIRTRLLSYIDPVLGPAHSGYDAMEDSGARPGLKKGKSAFFKLGRSSDTSGLRGKYRHALNGP